MGSPLAAAPASGAPTVTVRVKFGKELHELAIDLGAGVGPIQQRLAELTRVPPASQTLLAPGGRDRRGEGEHRAAGGGGR